MRFRAPRRITLCPWTIGRVIAAELVALAHEAVATADGTSSAVLQVRTRLMLGKVLLSVSGPAASLPVLKTAFDRASAANNPLTTFMATAEYGAQLTQHDLAEGMQILRDAERLLQSNPELNENNDPAVTRMIYQVQDHLGVNCLDAGLFDEAETTLHEALDILGDGEYDSTWRGYDHALLGRIALMRGHADLSLDRPHQAWQETEGTRIHSILPLVRNYYAEAIISAKHDDDAELTRASELLETCITDARADGSLRAEVTALSLHARARLALGDLRTAQINSTEAVQILERTGDLPTVCTEEVLYHHSRSLKTLGELADARRNLDQAWAHVERKAASIADPDRRNRFLAAVPLNAQIAQMRNHRR